MPIYEFQCQACSTITDEIRPMRESGSPGPACPQCNGETQRIYSVASTHASRTIEETQAMLKKRSLDHYKREIAPHRKDIERRALKLDSTDG
jgi:putative FmdB family regulatory protein